MSSDNQILLVGIRDGVEYILCYYFIGEDCDENIYYNEDVKVFDEIIKYKIDWLQTADCLIGLVVYINFENWL